MRRPLGGHSDAVTTTSPSAPAAPVFGPGPATLVVDGSPVAAVAVARTRTERRTGLLGSSGVDGALWLTRCGAVHTVGMTYPLEVAFLDRRGRCTAVRTMPPGRWSRPRLRYRSTLEAEVGSFAAWGLAAGSVVSTA